MRQEVGGGDQHRHGSRAVLQGLAKQRDDPARLLGVRFAVEDRRQPGEVQRGQRVRRRLGAIVVLLDAQHGVRHVGVHAVVAAFFLVEKQAVHLRLQGCGPLQPAAVKARLIKVEQRMNQAGVVDGEGLRAGAAVTPAPVQALPGLLTEPVVNELRRLRAELDELPAANGGPGTRQAADHEAVPGGDDLVVQMRARPLPARLKQGLDAAFDHGLHLLGRLLEELGGLPGRKRAEQRVCALQLALRVAFRTGVAVAARAIGITKNASIVPAQQRVDLGGGPDVERALPLVVVTLGGEAVSVLGREKAAVGMAKVALHITDDLARDLGQEGGAGDLVALGVGPEQLPLVVKHLFIMRDVPVAVDAVAVEAAADMVPDAARRHGAQGAHAHLTRPVGLALVLLTAFPGVLDAQQQVDRRGARELRRAAEAALVIIIAGREVVVGLAQHGLRLHLGPFVFSIQMLLKLVDAAVRALQHLLAILLPGLHQLQQQVLEADAPALVVRRKISAAKKGLQIRREKNAHRPAATTRRRLHVGHVGQVHVRPLLPVHLHRHEVLVDDRGDLLVLKRFALHHMTPVAGGITTGKKDGTSLGLRLRDRLVAPGQPVHRIVRMLKKIRGLFLREGVGELGRGLRVAHGGGGGERGG